MSSVNPLVLSQLTPAELRYQHTSCAEDRALWLARLGNRATVRTGQSCVGDDGRPENAGALKNMPKWSLEHRARNDAIFGTATEVAQMYSDCEFAEELSHDFELLDCGEEMELPEELRDSSFSQPVVGLFGAEPGRWKYDVRQYIKRAQEVKDIAPAMQYLNEVSPPKAEEIQPPRVEVLVKPPPQPRPKKKKRPRCIKPPLLSRNSLWVCTFTRTLIPKTKRDFGNSCPPVRAPTPEELRRGRMIGPATVFESPLGLAVEENRTIEDLQGGRGKGWERRHGSGPPEVMALELRVPSVETMSSGSDILETHEYVRVPIQYETRDKVGVASGPALAAIRNQPKHLGVAREISEPGEHQDPVHSIF